MTRKFDGYELGTFPETDKQQSDTYQTNRIARWYGSIDEYTNVRTEFVANRTASFETLYAGIRERLGGIITGEHFEKRPSSLGENDSRLPMTNYERADLKENILGNVTMDIGGNPQVLSSINEMSIVTMIERFAAKAPDEMKLQAGIEFAAWKLRQPIGSNQANGFVRSGAASFLDPYKHRGI